MYAADLLGNRNNNRMSNIVIAYPTPTPSPPEKEGGIVCDN